MLKVLYGGYGGNYYQPSESAEGEIDDASCSPEDHDDGCGFLGTVDAYCTDGESWYWECPDCGSERVTVIDPTPDY